MKPVKFPFYHNDKTMVFVDGAYLYAISRSLDFDIDYRKLLEWMGARGQLMRACYYTVLPEDQDYSPIRPLVDWLNYNGYSVVTKPIKEDPNRRRKPDMNIELTVDAMNCADKIDHVLIFSGDAELSYLIEGLQRKGVRVTVFGTIQAASMVTSDELRRRADHFFEMEDMIDEIGRGYDQARSDEDTYLPEFIEA